MYTREANAEHVAARASELAIEQQARLEVWLKSHSVREKYKFYIQAVEIEVSSQINYLMQEYAVLKGYVYSGQRLRVTRPAGRERASDER